MNFPLLQILLKEKGKKLSKRKSSGKWKWLKWIFVLLSASLLFVLSFLIFCNYWIISSTKKDVYNSIDSIPKNKVALVLGTSKYVSRGVVNPFYQNRIDAALALYLSGKVKYLILSGDNSTMDYNEPVKMKKDLVALGVPSSALFLDYAGFRTLDAVLRSKEIFGQTNITIVSQQFHNYRAVFLCRQNGIDAVAYNAEEIPFKSAPNTYYREYLARVKAVLDVYLLKTRPKFLGEKIIIPD